MHSRYPGGHGLFEEAARVPEAPQIPEPPEIPRIPEPPPRALDTARRDPIPLKLPLVGKNFNISELLKSFKIDWDAGDILLILILLFLFLESDDEEILIMMGLILFMGF